MVGIFDKSSAPENFGTNTRGVKFHNAPVKFDKKYKNIFNVGVNSNAEKFINKLEKRLRVNFDDVSGRIVNDAKAKDGTYYAKLVEFGFVHINGDTIPPQRIFGKNRRKIRGILYKKLKRSKSKVFSKKEVKKIIDETMIESIEILSKATPVGEKDKPPSERMKNRWKYIPAK